MGKRKRYTDVRKHQRNNPVNPGRHWVRKHQRFIGYRDNREVRLLQITHIADIKGVGGKTTTKLAKRGHLTIEDAKKLAQDPKEQRHLIETAGIRSQIMNQIVEAVREEPPKAVEVPKPPEPSEKISKPTEEEAYPYARTSEVSNIGEDVKDSRRHRWWEYKGASLKDLKEAEAAGVAHKTITKKELVKKLDVEGEIAAGKTAGHIYYHAQVLRSIPAKPPDTPEARKYYLEQTQAIQKICENTDDLSMLVYKLRKHLTDMSMEERTRFDTIMGDRAFNTISISTYQSSTIRNHLGKAYRLESIKGQKEEGRITLGKSTPQDYVKVREIFEKKEGKRKTSKIRTAFKNYQAEMLLKYAEKEEERFKFRDGKDAAQQTKSTFNLRAVQYGNYVSDTERAVQTQLAYGALHDMSKVLHMEENEVGIGGKLALAIGARGSGRAKAHHEPLRNVINLTATKGNGALAHEYGHYVDEKLYQASSSSIEGEAGGISKITVHGFMKSNPELKNAINQLNQRIEYSDFKHNARRHGSYWAKREEVFARAFAAYISDQVDNPYLVFPNKGDPKKDIVYELYPQGEERKRINESFDKVFKANKGRWNRL